MKKFKKPKAKTVVTAAVVSLSIASIAGCGIAMYDSLKPEAITNYQVDYVVDSELLDVADTLTISALAPNLLGYTFAGWRLSNTSDNIYTAGDVVDDLSAQDVTLYATYTSTLNLDLQGGYGTTSITAIKDNQMPDIEIPTKKGYTFGGYFTGKNGAGEDYYDMSGKSTHINDLMNGNTLYAYWIAD